MCHLRYPVTYLVLTSPGPVQPMALSPPPVREAGIIVETVDDLVDKLKNEAKVITWAYL